MMMSMSMKMGPREEMILAIPCPHCNRKRGHAPGCPGPELDHLMTHFRHYECPKCFARDVDLNLDDFYECRACHAQFTTGCVGDGMEEYKLLTEEAILTVALMPNPGTGKLKTDVAFAAVQERIRALHEKPKRRRKK